MSAVSAPAPEAEAGRERLAEISRLATLLADRVLDAQIMGKPVPDGHMGPLLDAGLLLKEYGLELPSLLGQIMLAAEGPELVTPPEPDAIADDAGRLAWLFRPFQGAKG